MGGYPRLALPAAPSGRMVPRMTTDHDVALSDFFAGLDSAVTGARRDHEARLAAFFAGLGPVVEVARRTQAVLDRRVAPQFSVFNYFKNWETYLSRAFGGLLDPAGTHGQGDVFLQLFLDEIRCSLNDDLRSGFPCTDTRGCDVYLEYPAGEGRKIDIVLKMPGNCWIGIENKPWAKEQENQISHYMKYLRSKAEEEKDAWILYLSGVGSPPETLPEPLEGRERCLTMPYRTRDGEPPSLENWICQCWKECESKRVRWFLKDLQEYIEKSFRLAGEP